jgi:hypothetical protein
LIRSAANKRREVCNHVGLVEITAPDSDIGPRRAAAAGRNQTTDSSDAGEELGTDVEHSAKSSQKVTCANAQIRCQLIDRKGGITAQTGGSLQYERLKAIQVDVPQDECFDTLNPRPGIRRLRKLLLQDRNRVGSEQIAQLDAAIDQLAHGDRRQAGGRFRLEQYRDLPDRAGCIERIAIRLNPGDY